MIPVAEEGVLYDLCVVGVGMAGLNVLAVAADYLDPSASVAVVDMNPGPGGMWHNTYDFVRLHQPHRLFTAGNIEWQLDKPPEHLASREEVLAHTRHCWSVLSEKLAIESWFSHGFVAHEPAEGGSLNVRISSVLDGTERIIRTKKLVKAFGLNVPTTQALSFQSGLVRSITPASEDFLGPAMLSDDAPIYVVGGGKTATDVAHELVTRVPDRKVEMFVGPGTAFFDRSRFFPAGSKRYYQGGLTLGGTCGYRDAL